jgi:hypothetical protein
MQLLVPIILFLLFSFVFAGVAARQKKESLRVGISLAGIVVMTVLTCSIIYPLGGYSYRVKAYQGIREIKEFLSDIQSDLQSNQQSSAEEKIEFILSNSDDTEFLENDPEWGTWIGDRVDESKHLKMKTDPDAGINSVTPLRDSTP